MKPKSIEEKKATYRKEAVHGVVFFALLQLGTAICFGSLCFIPDMPTWLLFLFAGLAVFCLILIGPALLVLKERFKEIEGGELDAAGQY